MAIPIGLELIEKTKSISRRIEYRKPTLSKEELERVLDCLIEDQLEAGSVVERFEKDFKSTLGLKNPIAVNSIFSAYHLALLSLEIQEGDKILLSSFSHPSALNAILLMKAIPVVVDLGKNSFHPDLESVKSKIHSENIKAAIFSHSFGGLLKISDYETGEVPVIEDFSEAVGADSDEVKVGKQGTISICGLSMDSVITIGNGAILTTSNDKYAPSIRSYIPEKCKDRKQISLQLDYSLIDYQAAIGIEQLSKLGIIVDRKRKIAQAYLQSLLGSSHETYFKKVGEDQFNRFPIVVGKPYDEVQRYFDSIHIATDRTIKEPIHRTMNLSNSDFPNAERLFQRGHCIPIYPNLTKDNVNRISSSLRGIF
ncbi:MAG: DegT/DnrJ/EryC1/StrS aminotransferase family protein [Leptospiraceae bacterium]|nr:DegT/DnrJ/EryC1/StrS aminotransferase family protein [Leptospiraceae bacterium]MCK6381576.1 DegT/DnrJ/EryC1/StrS aminotransferase family protein [Leptospiraceae bacterium]NUM40720.1 DegT/DnrJ/EryC1/StrS aminotransferase family protein [Leptospiraceae bacterium]